MLGAIQAWAAQLGGLGLFVIAALDSSFLSFPQVNDLLIIYLSTKNPERMPYLRRDDDRRLSVRLLPALRVARKGGEVFLRRRFSAARVDRGMALYQRWGLLAVVVPSLLPPPTPFKLFVLMAGAAVVAPWKFALAVLIGRGIRYFGQGYLAVRYGERAVTIVKENGAAVGIGLAVIALVIGAVVYWRQRSRSADPAQTSR